MRFLRPLSFILPLLSTALADVEFTAPASGSTLKGGHVVTAHWKESGELPRISQLLQYDIHLCAGGDTSDSYVSVFFIPAYVWYCRHGRDNIQY